VDSHDELTNAVADVVMLSDDGPSEETTPRPVFHARAEERYEPQSDLLAEPEAADVSMIDEETLRTMVSDIVRQELQGVLGERITRNVRKLVRREIHRVLMSQDYE
jgi:cell pole-organizing protein PopZ